MSAPSHVVEDQSEVAAFLMDPRSHGGASVERVDTHGAMVFLVGGSAYKLKRAVRFPYMDFSTIELRKKACEAEIRLNRRTAPNLYLRAQPVARTASGALTLGGEGTPVDWLVVMRRFPADDIFDRMAEQGRLDFRLMAELADAILSFHDGAEIRFDHGGASGIAQVISENDQGLREAGNEIFSPEQVARLKQLSDEGLEKRAELLDARRAEGLVRHCHGDLHLRNICLFEGRPTPFDAIEFNDQIACIDTLYDLAFLLMDLDNRGMRRHGNLVLNRYLSEGARRDGLGDLAGLAALPLFFSCRAGIRAQVMAAASATQPKRGTAQSIIAEARSYLGRALDYLAPTPLRLVAVGGLSGTGKSTLARALAPVLGPPPGAVIMRSDVIRKHLAGRDALERLGAEHYTSEMTQRVYETIRMRCREALAAGHGVIADAVYARPEERSAIEAIARELNVPFDGLWLDAPEEQLESRVVSRRDDASDATLPVLRQQQELELGEITWHRLDTGDSVSSAAARAGALLGLTVSQGFDVDQGMKAMRR